MPRPLGHSPKLAVPCRHAKDDQRGIQCPMATLGQGGMALKPFQDGLQQIIRLFTGRNAVIDKRRYVVDAVPLGKRLLGLLAPSWGASLALALSLSACALRASAAKV
jgi:hypothetical protein